MVIQFILANILIIHNQLIFIILEEINTIFFINILVMQKKLDTYPY